jgi:hypothetical protein
MAAVLSTPLPNIAFSKNPIWLKVISDDYLAAAPAIAVNYFEFDAAVIGGAQVVLSWLINGVTMTAEAIPDDTGNQFPTGDGSNAYVEGLVPYFQANFFIDAAFIVSADITGAHPRLIFTARVPGADFTFSTGLTSGFTTAGVDDAPVVNFMHHIEIWIANLSGGFDQAFTANVPLDEPLTGITSVDIHEALHSWLTQPDEFDTPILTALQAQYLSSLRAYFIKYAEFFGAVPSVQKINTTGLLYAALGGLGMQPALLRDIVAELCPVTGDATQNRFMRQGSKTKLATKEQPEWLSFINLTDAPVTATAEVIVYNSDETTLTFDSVTALVIAPYQKFQFQAGFNMLGITGRQALDKLPVYYTVRVKNADDAYITDTYCFVVDYMFREFPRYFVYENSYGAYQTIATVGKAQGEFDRTKTDAQLSLDRNTAAIQGDFLETNIFIQDKFTVNIGYDRSGKRNTDLLRDFMLSGRIYIYMPASETLIPIGLNTKNLKDAADGVNVFASSFEYYPKYEQDVWTEDAGLADDPLTELITEAGSPIPNSVPPDLSGGGYIVVEAGDIHLSIVGGQQVYTAPSVLTVPPGYRIWTTQMGLYFRTADISYNEGAGSFTILVPGFVLTAGDQLIIWPDILTP